MRKIFGELKRRKRKKIFGEENEGQYLEKVKEGYILSGKGEDIWRKKTEIEN